ncbi:Fc.00g111560.m01.CDS01 [Cosmosporella sp. VM-42]
MASVSSLDKDLRKLRLDKYTPAAANEVRQWIEETLGERLPSSDLLEGLKDGVALCKLVNLAIPPPGVKFKKSAMPFVQMENISHFLRACQAPPLNLQQHDTFLTVDLFEQKDPAQVLQCLGAFSRAANAANPSNFPSAMGPKARGGSVTPQGTGGPATPTGLRARGASMNSNSSSAYGSARPALPNRTGDSGSGRWSPTKSPTGGSGSPGPVSSWSRKEHEGSTAPAWNIAQYGYMGGASQGNLGISFGGRRQITASEPRVPNMMEKERRRREREAEEERAREEEERAREEEDRRQKAEAEAEEERARLEEERIWEAQTQQLLEKERQQAEDEKRRWEEEERQWKLTEEKRRKEEEAAEARLADERRSVRHRNDSKLRGQFLSQYQAEQSAPQDGAEDGGYRSRVEELEKELEQARQREAEYERERQGRQGRGEDQRIADAKARIRSRSRPARPPSRHESWSRDEREVLRTQWSQHQEDLKQTPEVAAPPPKSPRPLPVPNAAPRAKTPNSSSRPLPDPTPRAKTPNSSGRPLPNPATYSSPPAAQTRTSRFLSSNPAPAPVAPQQTYSRELGATAERDAEDKRRAESQTKTKAGGWASKSLLEREMEMERQRQKEWEDAQKETAAAARSGDGVDGIGGGVGGRWDVGQWSGFTGGDSQNKGAQGIGAGRRQIVGPRPLPDAPR